MLDVNNYTTKPSSPFELNPLWLKLYAGILQLYFFSIPFGWPSNQLSNILLIILFVISGFALIKSREGLHNDYRMVIFLFLCFYIIYLLSIVRSDDSSKAFYELEKKVSFLLLPVALYFVWKSDGNYRLGIRSFIVGCSIASLICFVYALYTFLESSDTSRFEYHEFSDIIKIQPGYLALHICIAFSFLLNQPKILSSSKPLNLTIGGFLLITVIVLSARMQIFLACIILIHWMILYFKQSLIKSVFLALGILLILIVIIFSFPLNRYRLEEALNTNTSRWGEKQIRGSIWPCAIETIKRSQYLGVGLGDVKDDLEKCYVERGYTALTFWEGLQFNAHNQYLEIAVGVGVPGLIYFLFMIAFLFLHSSRHRSKLACYVYFIFIMSCLTESILERQRGILPFATFLPLLTLNSKREND